MYTKFYHEFGRCWFRIASPEGKGRWQWGGEGSIESAHKEAEQRKHGLFASLQLYDRSLSQSRVNSSTPYLMTLAFDADANELADAYQTAKAIVDALLERFPPDSFEIYFTGKKGYAITVLPHIMGQTPRSDNNHILKEMAQRLCSAAGVEVKAGGEPMTVDPAMYSAKRLMRLADSLHTSTCLYRVRLSIDEFQNLTVEEHRRLAESPRENEPTRPSKVYREWMERYREAADYWDNTRPSRESSEPIEHIEALPHCAQWLEDGNRPSQQGIRNNLTFSLASLYRGMGLKEEETIGRMLRVDLNSSELHRYESNTRSSVNSTFHNQYDFHPGFCSIIRNSGVPCAEDRCPLFRRRSSTQRLTIPYEPKETVSLEEASEIIRAETLEAVKDRSHLGLIVSAGGGKTWTAMKSLVEETDERILYLTDHHDAIMDHMEQEEGWASGFLHLRGRSPETCQEFGRLKLLYENRQPSLAKSFCEHQCPHNIDRGGDCEQPKAIAKATMRLRVAAAVQALPYMEGLVENFSTVVIDEDLSRALIDTAEIGLGEVKDAVRSYESFRFPDGQVEFSMDDIQTTPVGYLLNGLKYLFTAPVKKGSGRVLIGHLNDYLQSQETDLQSVLNSIGENINLLSGADRKQVYDFLPHLVDSLKSDIENSTRTTYRTAMRSHWLTGIVTLYARKRHTLPDFAGKTLIYLDATGREEVVREVFPGMRVVNIDLDYKSKIEQVVDGTYSRALFRKEDERKDNQTKIKRIINASKAWSQDRSPLVYSYKDVTGEDGTLRERLSNALSGPSFGHFGIERGINPPERSVIVVGSNTQNRQMFEDEVAAFYSGQEIDFEITNELKGYGLVNEVLGTEEAAYKRVYVDRRVESFRWMRQEAGLIQALNRVRPVRNDDARILVLSSLPLEVPCKRIYSVLNELDPSTASRPRGGRGSNYPEFAFAMKALLDVQAFISRSDFQNAAKGKPLRLRPPEAETDMQKPSIIYTPGQDHTSQEVSAYRLSDESLNVLTLYSAYVATIKSIPASRTIADWYQRFGEDGESSRFRLKAVGPDGRFIKQGAGIGDANAATEAFVGDLDGEYRLQVEFLDGTIDDVDDD